MQKPELKTGRDWAEEFDVVITDNLLIGFGHYEYYYNQRITREEFLTRSRQCTVKQKSDLPKMFELVKVPDDTPKNYSLRRTHFTVDPALEVQATEDINDMGREYILEGATNLNNGWYRLWYRTWLRNSLGQKDIPIRSKNDSIRVTKEVSSYINKIIIPPKVAEKIELIEKREPSDNDKYFEFYSNNLL